MHKSSSATGGLGHKLTHEQEATCGLGVAPSGEAWSIPPIPEIVFMSRYHQRVPIFLLEVDHEEIAIYCFFTTFSIFL